jgi:hypothetical protein
MKPRRSANCPGRGQHTGGADVAKHRQTAATLTIRSGWMPDRNIQTKIGAQIKPQPDGCWLWTGTVNENGYGTCGSGPVHVFVYETLRGGPVPKGMHLHHRCQVKLCVNPEHLVLLTPSEHSREHHRLRRIAEA